MKRKFALALMLVLMLLMLVPFEALAQTIVDSSTYQHSLLGGFQKHAFYANGRDWMVYHDGSNIVLRTSADNGSTWSGETIVRTGALSSNYLMSVKYDGTYAYYVCSGIADAIYFRRFMPNADGSITYSAAEQSTGLATSRHFDVDVDTNGYPFIAYCAETGYPDTWRVSKSSTNDGTWVTEWTTDLDTTNGNLGIGILKLTSGKMAVVYNGIASDNNIYIKRWTGAAFGSRTVSGGTIYSVGISAVSEGDNVHVAYFDGANMKYTRWQYSTNGWDSAATLKAGGFGTFQRPAISIDETGALHIFWDIDSSNTVHYMTKPAGGSWTSVYTLVTDVDGISGSESPKDIVSAPETNRVNLGVYYMAATTIMKYKFVDEVFEVDTLTPTPLGNTYATLRGEIMSLGFGSATERGFLFNTSPTDIGAWLEGNETGTFNVGVFTHGITGLLAAHTYWYVAYASGDYGTSYGNWTSFYTTSPPAPTPPAGNVTGDSATICGTTVWNFLAQPVTNTDIKLTWDWWPVSGNSSTQIAIYYGLYYYPIDLADGTLIYQGTGDAYTHTNLSPGTTYYYRAWLLCGGNYSADYVQDWATTYGSSPVVSPPEQPEGWFQDPSCAAYSKIPLLSNALVAVTTAYGFPATTVCVMFTLLWIIVLGLAVFLFIHSAMMMIITIAVLIILASIMGLLPLWMIVIAICLGGISIYISGRT